MVHYMVIHMYVYQHTTKHTCFLQLYGNLSTVWSWADGLCTDFEGICVERMKGVNCLIEEARRSFETGTTSMFVDGDGVRADDTIGLLSGWRKPCKCDRT